MAWSFRKESIAAYFVLAMMLITQTDLFSTYVSLRFNWILISKDITIQLCTNILLYILSFIFSFSVLYFKVLRYL